MSDAEGNGRNDSREPRLHAAIRHLHQADVCISAALDADATEDGVDMDLLDAWRYARNARGRLKLYQEEGAKP